MKLTELSKEISYALRHAPWEYELELDEAGFVPVDQLLHAINESGNYDQTVTRADLEDIIRTSDKKRHEIVEDRIRALYGHSVPMFIRKDPGIPPDVLYHGTNDIAMDAIAETGLLPMSRQYVHMSITPDIAVMVAKRRKGNIVILEIDTVKARKAGVEFYVGNDKVWLAKAIPAEYLRPVAVPGP
jgi:putative RNA 2'-phosphotransferase